MSAGSTGSPSSPSAASGSPVEVVLVEPCSRIRAIAPRIRTLRQGGVSDNAAVDVPTIETERLLLRPWSETDREPFAKMNADREVMRFMSRRLDRAESEALIDRIIIGWQTDGLGLW